MADLLYTGIIIVLSSIPWLYLLKTVAENPENIEKWSSMIYRFFSWVSLSNEKKGLAGEIQADIRKTSRLVNAQVPEKILPYGIKIKWVNEGTRDAFVKNKEVVIKMNHHRNQAKNYLNATISYMEFGLIPKSRNFLGKRIMRAVELIFSNKIFVDNKRYDVRQIFLDEIFNPETQNSTTLERYCNIFDGLEKTGQFTRIAIKEFSDIGDKLSNGIPRKEISDEVTEFTKMLERLVRKERGRDIGPTYNGKFINCAIVLVARPETYYTSGIEPWLRFISRSIERGIDNFYVCAIGNQNVKIAQEIADAYEESKEIKLISKEIYTIRKSVKAININLSKV